MSYCVKVGEKEKNFNCQIYVMKHISGLVSYQQKSSVNTLR